GYSSNSNPFITATTQSSPHNLLWSKIKSATKIKSKEDLEQKIGSVWASRIGALLVMTAVVLGTRTTFYSAGIGIREKIIIGYAFSIMLILGGWFSRKKNIFSEVILSCGLTGIYFTTYAGFFIEETHLFPFLSQGYCSLLIGFPVLLVCLFPLILIAHKRKSSTIAGIGLFLTYYTVALSCYNEPNIRTLSYALLTSITIAFITFVFHLIHNWFFLSWPGVIASYATYLYVFPYLNPHTYFHIPEKAYFWISFLFLTTCFLLFSITCIMDARKRGEYRKGIAPLVGLNSVIYFCLTFYAVRTYYLPYEYLFRTGFVLMLLTFSLIAHFTGPRNNYIFQVFIIKTIIMITLAIQSYFSGEKLLIALSIECLALALAHKRSGYLVYRVMNFFLLWVTFFWGITYIKTPGIVSFGAYHIPANWFAIWGASLFLFVIAWFYEHFVSMHQSNIPEWTYEINISNIKWRFSPLLMSVLHACVASLLILLLTVVDFIDDLRLPLVLTTELLLLLGIGFISSTPSIEFSGVLLLVSAQACYLFYFFTNPQSLYELPYFLSMSFPLAFISYIGAYAWEKYLNRIHPKQDDDVHFTLSILPYISSILITLIVINQITTLSLFPVIVSILGMVIYGVSTYTQLPSLAVSGKALILTATLYFLIYLSKIPEEYAPLSNFLVSLFISGILIGAERIKSHQEKELLKTDFPDIMIRIMFLSGVVSVHLSFAFICLPKNFLIFYWLATGLTIVFLGMFLHESLYRWIGFCVLFVTLFRTFFVFQYISSEIYQVLSFAVSALVLFLIGWIYSRNQTSN
ncbi:MAG: DUF2339 domain-containing protein, partial [Candidatus Hydrogenedens sp.]